MGTAVREKPKKVSPPARKGGGASASPGTKKKCGVATAPAAAAVPEGPLIPPHVARFLASIPMTPDPVEWILGFRAALQELLGDVDRIAIDMDVNCPLDRTHVSYLRFQVDLCSTGSGGITETSIGLGPGIGDARHKRFLNRLQRLGHDLSEYQAPIGIDYVYQHSLYLASMLLFRERHRPRISVRTLEALEVLRPFLVYVFSSHVVRGMTTFPAKRMTLRAIQEVLSNYSLTERESEALTLKAFGLSSAGIAERLFITEHTVKKRLASIRRKTGAASFFELFMRYVPKEEGGEV